MTPSLSPEQVIGEVVGGTEGWEFEVGVICIADFPLGEEGPCKARTVTTTTSTERLMPATSAKGILQSCRCCGPLITAVGTAASPILPLPPLRGGMPLLLGGSSSNLSSCRVF